MILVTGATGLLGRQLVNDLVLRGQRVRALSRGVLQSNLKDAGIPPFGFSENVDWVSCDITNPFDLDQCFKDIHAVYHCAGQVSFVARHRRSITENNVSGTANVVNACLKHGISALCHVSSVAAFGRATSGNTVDESTEWVTSKYNSHYAVSKYEAELEVWRGICEGLNAVIVNPGIIIGPGNWKTDSSGLFGKVWNGLNFYTEGRTGFVCVTDVSRIMIRLMEMEAFGQRFALVGENLTFREVMDVIADELDKPRPNIKAGRLLTNMAWMMEALRSRISGVDPIITRETARSARSSNVYVSDKVKQLTGIEFTDIRSAVKKTAKAFMNS